MGRSCRCAACATAARPHAGGLRSTWPARTATRIPSCPPAASLAPPRRPWTAPATFISPALTSDPTAAGLTTRPAPTSTPDEPPALTTKWSAPEVRRGWSRCLRNSRCGGLLLVLVDPGEQVVEVGGGELPLEGPGGGVVALLEAGQSLADLVEVGEVVGCHDLALHH